MTPTLEIWHREQARIRRAERRELLGYVARSALNALGFTIFVIGCVLLATSGHA